MSDKGLPNTSCTAVSQLQLGAGWKACYLVQNLQELQLYSFP